MKIRILGIIAIGLLCACGESDKDEIYNENNTNVVDGIVYDINEKPINGIYKIYYPNGNVKMEVRSKSGIACYWCCSTFTLAITGNGRCKWLSELVHKLYWFMHRCLHWSMC